MTLLPRRFVQSCGLSHVLVVLGLLGWGAAASAQAVTGSIVSVLQEGPNTRISIEAEEGWTVQRNAGGFVRGLVGASRSNTAQFIVREVRGQQVEADIVRFTQVPVVGDPARFTSGVVRTVEIPVTLGILRIRTEPSGATVYVDGEVQGTAPVAIERAIGTTVQIAVELEGYRSRNQRWRVTQRDATLAYELVPVQEGATLVLTTLPLGAEVVYEENVIGETPLRYFFNPGLVELELRKDGFRPSNIVVEIPESGTVQRTDSLLLARSRLDLIADRDALVVLDGDTLGISPQEALGREPATYAVWFLHPGFEPYVEYVVITEPGETKEVRATLRTFGSEVRVATEPEGTEVLLDGVALGRAPLTLRVPAGSYELSVQGEGRPPVARPEPLVVGMDEEIGVAVRLGPGATATWASGYDVPAGEAPAPGPEVAADDPASAAAEETEAPPPPTTPQPSPDETPAPAADAPPAWAARVDFDARYPLQGGQETQREYSRCIQEGIPDDLEEEQRVALLFDVDGQRRVTQTPVVVRGSQGWLSARASRCLQLLTFESSASNVLYDIQVVRE